MANQWRMIHTNISHGDRTNMVSDAEALFFTWFSVWGDDHGRARGGAEWIKHVVFPYKKWTVKKIEAILCRLNEVGLIQYYHDEKGNRYVQFNDWYYWQRLTKESTHRKPSEYPEPPEFNESDVTGYDFKRYKATTVERKQMAVAPVGSKEFHKSSTRVPHEFHTSSLKEKKTNKKKTNARGGTNRGEHSALEWAVPALQKDWVDVWKTNHPDVDIDDIIEKSTDHVKAMNALDPNGMGINTPDQFRNLVGRRINEAEDAKARDARGRKGGTA